MNWSITDLRVADIAGREKVVTTVGWQVEKDGIELYATIRLSAPQNEFIDFNSLTEDVVLDWVFSKLNRSHIEAKLQSKIDNHQSHKPIKADLPW